jgi:hypothetical protein
MLTKEVIINNLRNKNSNCVEGDFLVIRRDSDVYSFDISGVDDIDYDNSDGYDVTLFTLTGLLETDCLDYTISCAMEDKTGELIESYDLERL